MSYLRDYEEIDGGYVAFGGNPKGGKITGKCTIKTVTGDLHSVTLTRNMTKNLEEHGFVSTIHQRTNHNDLHNCLFVCFLSQEEPKKKKGYSTKWVFRNKKNERGIVIRNKAMLVAQGQTQEKGIDYDEVFAHVARIEAIMLFLAYDLFKDFVVYQMDVKSAFLYGKIEKEVHVCQPPGFEDPGFPDRVHKVEKALYELHQAPKAWYETLSAYLLDNGFQRGKINKTLFIKRYKGDILLVQVYVDDIIFGSTRNDLCNAFERLMNEKFQMSSMGELTFFLGVKNASTPMETQKPLLKDEDGEEVDFYVYRYQVNLKVSHLHAMKRNFRKSKRKNTQVPQPSGFTKHVTDEAVYKKLDEKLVRVAITTSRLGAEHDSGIKDNIQSKATPNEAVLQELF
nr:hypothetical protein [Tanacetum cinerariifolium]